jgi:uncharacterized protein (TIGR02246 family)
MRKRRIGILAIGLAVALAGPFLWIGTMPAQQKGQIGDPKEGTGYGKRAQAFIAAFNKGDAKAVAAFWTPDGDYTDQVGEKYKGRAALEKLYEKVFAERKGAKLTIHVGSIRKLTPDVVIEEGITEVTPGDGGLSTAAAFTAVVVKYNGEWHFASVQDTITRPPSNAAHFEDLEWLIGEWTGPQTKGESARSSFAWAENKNFIVSSFATTLSGVPVIGGTQWIGWDAVDKQIRSYSFYSGGGIGEGVWTNDGKSWHIKTNAKSADGRRLSAVNVITKLDADNASWQITNLTVDGKTMPDTPPVKLQRVKGVRP